MPKYFAFATTAHGREITPRRLRQRERVILSGSPFSPHFNAVTERLPRLVVAPYLNGYGAVVLAP